MNPIRFVLEALEIRCCPSCTQPLHCDERFFCHGCGPLIDLIDDGPSLFVYGGPIQALIHAIKFERQYQFIPVLRQMLQIGIQRVEYCPDLVVPVPEPWIRRVREGQHIATTIAQAVASHVSAPCRPQALVAKRGGRRQRHLSQRERRHNPQNRFWGRIRHCKNKRILLVDDVRTTGATLDAARNALLNAGAQHVKTLAFAGVGLEGRTVISAPHPHSRP